MINLKILSYKSPRRYAVKNTLVAAVRELQKSKPNLAVEIEEITTLAEIEHYTNAIILPSLVVNEKLACIGRFPKKEEVTGWLQAAVAQEERTG